MRGRVRLFRPQCRSRMTLPALNKHRCAEGGGSAANDTLSVSRLARPASSGAQGVRWNCFVWAGAKGSTACEKCDSQVDGTGPPSSARHSLRRGGDGPRQGFIQRGLPNNHSRGRWSLAENLFSEANPMQGEITSNHADLTHAEQTRRLLFDSSSRSSLSSLSSSLNSQLRQLLLICACARHEGLFFIGHAG